MARDITQLHPRLQEKIEDLKVLCKKEGLALGIGECFRSVAEQDSLYAQGRTKAGSIVTNAKGSTYSSQHQWGIAFDFFKNVKGHEYDDASFFKKVGKLAKSIGLAWGGDWTGFVDRPHLYLPDWGSTTSKLKKQYGTFENFKKTWTDTTKPKPTATTKKKTLEEWAKEVIAGKHGNGHENRKASLKKVGCTFAYSDVKEKVNALLGAKTSEPSPYYPKYIGKSYGIDTVFKSIGVPEKFRGNYKNRNAIAKANGISKYTGSASQNIKLIDLAKQGKLKKA